MFKSTKTVFGLIYFIRAPNAIKVGFAQNIAKRFADIQTANPDRLALLGSIEGNYEVEKAILYQLAKHHIRGEWLHAHPEVIEYVNNLLSGRPAGALPDTGVSTMPIRIQRSRAKGWRMPANTIYVGRPSRYGNKYRPGRHGDAAECVRKFREDWEYGLAHPLGSVLLNATLNELRGHDLACWCALDLPCHADVLLELANAPRLLRSVGT
jgi:hypothetical protein